MRWGNEDAGDAAARIVAGAWCAEAAEADAAVADQVADQARVEFGRTTLRERLRGHRGGNVLLRVTGLDPVAGFVELVEAEWLRIAAIDGPCYVALDKIEIVEGLNDKSDPPSGLPPRGWTQILRQLAEAGNSVTVATVHGDRIHGRVLRAGLDHFDLLAHDRPAYAHRAGQTIANRTIAAIWVR